MGPILVTGATRGIGRAIVDRLLADGRQVVGVARHADPAFPAPLLAADLASEAESAALLRQLAAMPPFAGLVNNAGINRPQRLDDVTREDWQAVLDVDLWRPLQIAQALLPGMRRLGTGRIVNIASRAMRGLPRHSAYAAAKAGLDAMGRCWALELAEQGITVNTVAPGPVETELFWSVMPREAPATQAYLASVPVGRIGHPAEIAAAAAFFLSPDAGFVTGQTLYVCGGLTVG